MTPFAVGIGDDALEDLERRLRATRWLDGGSGHYTGFGTPLGFVQEHCRYWLDSFDWRATEARINRFPQVMAEVEGLQLHAIHRPSSRADAVPLILIHGWPTSFLEFLPVIDGLAEPPEGEPAFHVVVPSLPGYAFSQTRPGISPRRIAALFMELMNQLGYARFLVQGGNWGSSIGVEMARDHPERVIGLHLNTVNGSAPPDAPELSARDQAIADTYATLLAYPHFNMVAQAPLTVAHAVNDSPAGTVGWMADKLFDWADPDLPGNPGRSPEWIVATCALYWLTGTAATSAALYREAVLDPVPERFVEVPVGVAHYAAETVMIPRPWAERHYNIVRWNEIASGGHYPATEVPDLFTEDLRAFAAALCGPAETG